jgi:metal-responsive CopG/Arc/MetJ family transcriptional regulator
MTLKKMKEKVSITIEKKLLKKIDADRGLVNRSCFIEHKLEDSLGVER